MEGRWRAAPARLIGSRSICAMYELCPANLCWSGVRRGGCLCRTLPALPALLKRPRPNLQGGGSLFASRRRGRGASAMLPSQPGVMRRAHRPGWPLRWTGSGETGQDRTGQDAICCSCALSLAAATADERFSLTFLPRPCLVFHIPVGRARTLQSPVGATVPGIMGMCGAAAAACNEALPCVPKSLHVARAMAVARAASRCGGGTGPSRGCSPLGIVCPLACGALRGKQDKQDKQARRHAGSRTGWPPSAS